MAINASQIVKVIPRTINGGASELEIVGMYLTTNSLCPFPSMLSFTTASAVASYFGKASREYDQAVKYFLGYTNSFTKPKRLWFGRYVKERIDATYMGVGAISKISVLQGITNGKCKMNVSGHVIEVTGVNFSDTTLYTTPSACGKELQRLVQLALGLDPNNEEAAKKFQIDYDSNLDSFVMKTHIGTTGDEDYIEVLDDGELVTVSGETLRQNRVLYFMGLCDEKARGNGTTWKGSEALTPSVNMDSIIELEQNWVSFTTLDEIDADEIMKFAEWVNGTQCEYLYAAYTSDVTAKNPLVTTNLPHRLAAKDYEGVILVYGGDADRLELDELDPTDYATLIMSMGACIDWERINGVITYAFKSQSGLGATVDNDTDASNCLDMKVNFYGNYATRNDSFVFFYNGAMAGGVFGFVDAYVSQLWLRNVLQVALLNGLTQFGRIPYNDEGYTIIKALCQDSINRALNNGTINVGVSMSEAQKAQIMTETGDNGAPDEIYLNGYYLQVSDPSTTVRAQRGTPVLGLWYTYGGAIQKLELPCTTIL